MEKLSAHKTTIPSSTICVCANFQRVIIVKTSGIVPQTGKVSQLAALKGSASCNGTIDPHLLVSLLHLAQRPLALEQVSPERTGTHGLGQEQLRAPPLPQYSPLLCEYSPNACSKKTQISWWLHQQLNLLSIVTAGTEFWAYLNFIEILIDQP